MTRRGGPRAAPARLTTARAAPRVARARGAGAAGTACVAALAVAVVLGGCVPQGIQQTALPARVDYVCQGEKLLQVARGTAAAVVRFEEREATLPEVASAAQEKYTNGEWTLYLDGERALLESRGVVLAGGCRSTVPLPRETRQR
jgi:membrane-bound inhibitor of C-type lysozyme